MNENKNDVEEHNFSGLEINARRKKLKISDFFEWVFSIAYKIANNYGRSLWLPLMWIFLIFCSYTVYYYRNMDLVSLNPRMEYTSLYNVAKSWSSCTMAAYTSGLNSLGPLRYLSESSLILPSSARAQAIFFAQALITTLLWFLFITGIRRRFKTQ